MNYKLIANYIGNILRIEGLFMIPALLVSLYYREYKCVIAFGISIAALLVVGQLMHIVKPKQRTVFVREGFAIVSLSWIAISLFGALPFFISREIPNFIDCFFEIRFRLYDDGIECTLKCRSDVKGLALLEKLFALARRNGRACVPGRCYTQGQRQRCGVALYT